jgi:hypothetical protein
MKARAGPSSTILPGLALGQGSLAVRTHTSCAVVVAPTLDRAFARWCLTVEHPALGALLAGGHGDHASRP